MEKRWVFCPKCKHKLFLADIASTSEVEIKCHSCKAIDVVYISNMKIKVVTKHGEN